MTAARSVAVPIATPDRPLARIVAWCGIVGPLALTAYFVAPLFLDWPFAGGTAATLSAYALSHASFLYAGAWLQAVGSALSVTFFLGLVALARAAGRASGLIVLAGAISLLALVLVEGVFMVAAPIAAASGDTAMAATVFTLANGVFVRAFAVVPAPATYAGLGMLLRDSAVVGPRLATSALVIAIAFELAAFLSILHPAGAVLAIVLSVAQSLWIWSAAVALLRRT